MRLPLVMNTVFVRTLVLTKHLGERMSLHEESFHLVMLPESYFLAAVFVHLGPWPHCSSLGSRDAVHEWLTSAMWVLPACRTDPQYSSEGSVSSLLGNTSDVVPGCYWENSTLAFLQFVPH